MRTITMTDKVFTVDKLNEFTRAYIECALWSSTDNSTEQGGDPLDKNHSIEDLPEATVKRMADDCDKFQKEHAMLLDVAYAIESAEAMHPGDLADAPAPKIGRVQYGFPSDGYSESNAGHDFWLTRNGHGAGFWDRDLGDVGDKLSEASKAAGEVDLYVGDDGKVYVA